MRVAFLAAAGLLAATPARAGVAACWYEGGTLVVAARVAGIAGDFILDTGTPRSLLHETAAQAHGIEDPETQGDVTVAGVTRRAVPLAVQDLDIRTWNLPTPVAGVIGADILKGYVLDVTYAPCRVRLSRAGRAPQVTGVTLPLSWDQDRPTVAATVGDGAHELAGAFVIATGANAPVRLADDLASAPADKPAELYPDGVWLARLPVVRFGGAEGQDVAAGLMKPDGAVAGVLGADVLAHFRLRFDFPAGRLTVQPLR